MTDVSIPRAPAKPSLAQITQGMLGAPGTTVGGGLYNPTWGSAKELLQQSKPPAPRSLLTQVWDVIRGAPAGLVHLGGTAAQTFFSLPHLAYDAAFNRDDLRDVNSLGDFTSQYLPLADELVRSAGQTLSNVIHPSHYLDAIREGDIVGTVLNDVGNIALVGGAVAKGLGAAGSSVSAATLRESIASRLAEGTIGEAAAKPYLAAANKMESGSGLAGRMSRAGELERAQHLTRAGNVIRQGAHRLDDIADMPFPALRWATGKAGDLLAPNVERMVGERLGRAYTIPREGGSIPLNEVMRHAIVGTRAADSRLLSRITPMGRDFANKVSSDLVDRTLRAQTVVAQVGERAESLARENGLPTARQDPTFQRLTSAAVLDTVGTLEQQLRTWVDNYRDVPAGPERDAVLRDIQEQVTRLYEGASASSFIPRPDVVKTLLDERAGLLPDGERVFLEGMRPALRSMYVEAEQMGAQGVGGRVITPEEMGSEVMSIEVARQRARLEKQLEANAREMGPARERARSDERLANVYRAVADAMDDAPDLPGIITRVRSAARQDVNVARAEGMVRVAKERVKQLATELNRAVRMGDSDLDRRVTELQRATERYNLLRDKEREALAAYEAARSAPPDTPPGGPAGPTSPQTPTPDGGVPPVAPAARAIEPAPAPEPTPAPARVVRPSRDERSGRQSTAVPKERPAPPKISDAAAPARSVEGPDTPRGRLQAARDAYQRAKAERAAREQEFEAASRKRSEAQQRVNQLQAASTSPASRIDTSRPAVREAFPEFASHMREWLSQRSLMNKVVDLVSRIAKATSLKAVKDGKTTAFAVQAEALSKLIAVKDDIASLSDRLAAVGPLTDAHRQVIATAVDKLSNPDLLAALDAVEASKGKMPTFSDAQRKALNEAQNAVNKLADTFDLLALGGLRKGDKLPTKSDIANVERVMANDMPAFKPKEQQAVAKKLMARQMDEARGLFVGEANGELWWSNSYVMGRVQDAPAVSVIDGPGQYHPEGRHDATPLRFQSLLDARKDATTELRPDRLTISGLDDNPISVVLTTGDDTQLIVNEEYLKSIYREGDQLLSVGGSNSKPVFVVRDGQTVGMLMPIRNSIEPGEVKLGSLMDDMVPLALKGIFGISGHPAVTRLLEAADGVDSANGADIARQLEEAQGQLRQADAEQAAARKAQQETLRSNSEFDQAERAHGLAIDEVAASEVESSPLLSELHRVASERNLQANYDNAARWLQEALDLRARAKPSMKMDDLRRMVSSDFGYRPKSKQDIFNKLDSMVEDRRRDAEMARTNITAGKPINHLTFVYDLAMGRNLSSDPQLAAQVRREAQRVVDLLEGGNAAPETPASAASQPSAQRPTPKISRAAEPSTTGRRSASISRRSVDTPAPKLADAATPNAADGAPVDLRSTVNDVVEVIVNSWVGPMSDRDALRRVLSMVKESPERFDEVLPAIREQLVTPMKATPNVRLGGALRQLIDKIDERLAATPKLAESAQPVRTAQRRMPEVRGGMPRPELVKELGIEVPVAWRDIKTVDQGPALWRGETKPLRESFYDGLIPTRRNHPVYTAPLRTLEEVKAELDGRKPIVCIACGESKLDRAAPAGELYTSDAFKKNLEAALALVDGDRSRVFVISAKHGYLPLDQVVDPYEASFKQRERTVNGGKDYITTPNIMRAQAQSLPDGPAVVLGGKDYTGAVIATIGDRPVVPVFNGTKGIGEQKQIAGSIAAGAKRPDTPTPKLADAGAATPPPPEPPAAPEAAAGGGEPPRPDVAAAKTALDETRGQRKEARKAQKQAVGRVVAADKRDQALRAERDPEFELAGRYPQERRTSPHAEQGFVDPDTEVGALRDEVSPGLAAIDKKATGQELTSRVEKAAQKVIDAEQDVEVKKRSAQAAKAFADLTDDEKAAYNAHRRRRDREGQVKAMSKAERINRRLGAAEEQARMSAARLRQIEDRQNLTMREIADLPVTIARPVQARMRDLVHGRSKSLSLENQGAKGPIKPDDWIEMSNGRWGRVIEAEYEPVVNKAGDVVIDKATGKPMTEVSGWSVDMGGGKVETAALGEGWRWRSNKGGAIGSLRNQLRRVAPPLGEAYTVEIDQWKGLSGDEKRDLADAGEEQFRTEMRGRGPIHDTIAQAAKRGDYNPIEVVQQIEALPTDRARVTWLGEHADELGLTPKEMEGLLHSVEIDERLVQFETRVAESHADGSWMDLPIELGRMTEDLGWAPQEYHNARNLTIHRYKDARVRSLADDALHVEAMPARWRPTAMMARRQIKVMLDEAERLRGEGLHDAARYQLSLAAEVATNIRDLADMGIDPIYVTGGPPAPMGQAVDSLRPRPNRADYQRKTPYTVLNFDEAQATQLSVMVQRHRNHTYRVAEETFGKTLSEIPELHDWLRGFVGENNRYPTSDEFIAAAKSQGWSLIDRGKGLGRTKNVNLAAQLDEELKLANEIHDTAIESGDEARIQRTRFELEEAQRRRDRAVAVTPKSLRDAWAVYDRARNDYERLTAQDTTTGPYPFGVDPNASAAAEQRMRQAAAVLAEAEAASMPMLVPDAIAVEMARDATLWDRGMLPGFRTLAKSNRFFKNQVLPLSARWYANNALGNVLMAAAFGGVSPRQLFRQIRALRNDLGLTGLGRKSQDAMEAGLLAGKLDVGTVRGARIPTSGLLESQRRGIGLAEFDQSAEARTRAGRALRAVTDRGYGINEMMDNVYRSAVYLAKIEKYVERGARSGIDVVTPAGVQRVAEAALKDTLKAMGDYTNMAPWQRKYLRQIFPWWSWIRHSTVAAMRLPIEHPMRALWLGQLSELANEDNLSGDELAFFGGRWMLGDGRSIPIASLSPLEDPLQNPIFNPPGLIRGIAPLIKIGAVAATGLDLGRISQVTQPPDKVKRGAFGQQVADPLIYDPMALAGYAVGQFPMLKNLRDVLEGPAVRYGTGEAIVDRKGNPIPSGKSQVGSLAAIFGIPWPEDVTPTEAAKRKKERVTLGQ